MNILVILASFNGGKYIKEQLDSILEQKSVKVDIRVFDDCSQDDTIQVLNEYKTNSNIFVQKRKKSSGSAAINFAWVANGRLTSYFEADLNVWDVAAGALLVQEAGGKVTDVWGQEYSLTTRNIVSSNGKIHSELLENLQEVKMWL